jgi:hypothetical protein
MVDGKRLDELVAYPQGQLNAAQTLIGAWNPQGIGADRTQKVTLDLLVQFVRQAIGNPEMRHTSVSGNLSLFDEVIVDGTTLTELTLPANTTGQPGRIAIYSPTAKIRLKQLAGQRVRFNDDLTALGTGGFIESVDTTAYLAVVSTGPNLWMVYGSNGNFNVNT